MQQLFQSRSCRAGLSQNQVHCTMFMTCRLVRLHGACLVGPHFVLYNSCTRDGQRKPEQECKKIHLHAKNWHLARVLTRVILICSGMPSAVQTHQWDGIHLGLLQWVACRKNVQPLASGAAELVQEQAQEPSDSGKMVSSNPSWEKASSNQGCNRIWRLDSLRPSPHSTQMFF